MKDFDYTMLATVARLQPNAYGVPIADALNRSRLRLQVPIGKIYSTLERLEAAGLVTSWEGNATAERGWREKRYWTVTVTGRDALETR
jgi:PadR family transcriptional regulator, regulatory protein PadR